MARPEERTSDTMNDAAFLADICANPDDDTPRLVYADWLEDHGDSERAEFIRTQIRYVQIEHYLPESHRLYARQKELVERHREEWLGPLARIHDPAVSPEELWTFVRGFVEEVRMW